MNNRAARMKKILTAASAAAAAAALLSFPASAAGWSHEPTGWSYTTESGVKAQSGWLFIDGKWYFFDDSGLMSHDTWVDCYYVGSDGALLTDTVTPDGVRVASDGTPVLSPDESLSGVYYAVDGSLRNRTTVVKDLGDGALDVRFCSLNTRAVLHNSTASPDLYTGSGNGRNFSLRFTGSSLYITVSDDAGVDAVRNEKYIYRNQDS